MASDLTGMFAQLNSAIKGSPLNNDVGMGLLHNVSQNVGQAGAHLPTREGQQAPNPYSFMTPQAKKQQGMLDMAGLDLQTVEGLAQASQVAGQAGDTEKQQLFAQQAKTLKGEQTKLLDEGNAEIQSELLKKQGMQLAQENNDTYASSAIRKGLLNPKDYAKTLLDSRQKAKEAAMGRDPYAGAFTEQVLLNGKEVKVRFDKKGEPLAILGEGRYDTDLKEVFNPAVGAPQMALIDKNNPNNIQFVGGAEIPKPEYEITEKDGKFHVWMTPSDGSTPVRVTTTDVMTDAEKAMANAKSQVETINLVSSIDEAIAMIDGDARVGGWYGPLEYLPASDQRSFDSTLNSIRSNVGFTQLTDMRAAGGTLGQVSNIENMLLQSYVRNLDGWTDKRVLRKNLEAIKNLRMRVNRADSMANPETLFVAERDNTGAPTGNKIYSIDANNIAVLSPNGEIEIVTAGQEAW